MPAFSPDLGQPAVFLFRRDLRLEDQPALVLAAKHKVLHCVYVLDPQREASGGASNWWLHYALESLHADLEKKGQCLQVLVGDTANLLRSFCKKNVVAQVYTSRGYSPQERNQDADFLSYASDSKWDVHFEIGNYLFEPEYACKADGSPYRVFTPFWRNLVKKGFDVSPIKKPRLPKCDSSPGLPKLSLLPSISWDREFYDVWNPRESAAHKALVEFIDSAATGYKDYRDIPSSPGTSRLSPYLAFGQVSPRTIWHACTQAFGSLPQIEKKYPGVYTYLKEIAWREFANHLLFFFPRTVDEELQPAFRRFPWKKKNQKGMQAKLRAWQMGQTGVPIVDAGMRQLWRTGWMHNRVRMVVASFLVKNLGLDWRYGAAWFMDTLVDADLASNTMGWQWAAGSGADAAPYFRVFNPTLQGERFDKQGAYVKSFIPEISEVPQKLLHKPWELPPLESAALGDYPEAVVCLKASRDEALARYKAFK